MMQDQHHSRTHWADNQPREPLAPPVWAVWLAALAAAWVLAGAYGVARVEGWL